jgi:hypothetical protein
VARRGVLAVSFRDRGITDYFEPLLLGQTAPFGWLALAPDGDRVRHR